MNKIVLILPYFGKLPAFFDFYLASCKHNPTIDFLIFTDCDIAADSPNIRVIKSSWADFVRQVQAKFDFPIALDSPYKLCDLKPAYGYIFQKYITDYAFWGHCDCDLIWGDLSVLNRLIEEGYDKVGEYGHLVLYRNTDEVNRWFMTLGTPGVPSYRQVFASPRSYSFDEFSGMSQMTQAHHKKVYTGRLFDDIIFYKKNFFTRRLTVVNCDTKWKQVYFSYQAGHLYRHVLLDGQWHKDESLYVHFQKRPLKVETQDVDRYIVIPNRIVEPDRYTPDELKRLTRLDYLDVRYWKLITKGGIKQLIFKLRK
jgi:hypothetical protein